MPDIKTEPKMLTCCVPDCGRQHESSRNPNKKYRVWKGDCYCNDPDQGHDCFSQHVQTRVFKFGAAPATRASRDGVEVAKNHMFKMNVLWNRLVEIDNYERTEYRRLTDEPELAAEAEILESKLEALLGAVQHEKIKGRKKRISNPQLDSDIKLVKADLKRVRADLKQRRVFMKALNAAAIESLKKNTESRITKAIEASKADGLLHTNFNKVLQNFKTASRKARKEGSMLRFHRFEGTGRINIDETNGLDLANAFSSEEKGNFQIGPVLKTLYGHGKGRTVELRDVRIRVESGNKGVPVWLKVPTIFHRQIPEGTTIQNACVTLKRVADKEVWNTNVAVRMPAPLSRMKDHDHSAVPGTIAIDLGWRKMPDGMRVAYWADTEGKHGEIVLPDADFGAQFKKLHDLQAIMDKRFNAIRDTLAPWLRSVEWSGPKPVWDACGHTDRLTQAFSFTMHQWKSHGKAVHLLKVWTANRFDGDKEMYDALQVWYHGDPPSKEAHKTWKGTDSLKIANATRKSTKPDLYNGHRHLWQWWCNLGDQLQKRRQDLYRCFAAGIAKAGYKQVVLEEFDLRAVAEKPKVEDALKAADPIREVSSQQDEASRRQRTEASVSMLRGAVENVCGREGIVILRTPAQWTTKSCTVCGDMVRVNAAKSVIVQCNCSYAPEEGSHCWDQDHNACRNLLDAALPLGWDDLPRIAAD